MRLGQGMYKAGLRFMHRFTRALLCPNCISRTCVFRIRDLLSYNMLRRFRKCLYRCSAVDFAAEARSTEKRWQTYVMVTYPEKRPRPDY